MGPEAHSFQHLPVCQDARQTGICREADKFHHRPSLRGVSCSFWLLRFDEIQTHLNPGLQVSSKSIPFRSYKHEPSHRAAGKSHGPRMRLRKCLVIAFRACAYDQVISNDSTAHVPVHHEREPAEHALLVYGIDPAQECSDSYRY